MKTKTLHFLIGLALISFNYSTSQTTHDLNWFTGIGSNVDLTINIGDTVRWTWTDAPPHTVENDPAGSSVETFDSGILTGVGQTYSYTFTVEGANDYYCGVHGAVSMSGTITVENNLSLDEHSDISFKIIQSSKDRFDIRLPRNYSEGELSIYDLLGKRVMTKAINNQSELQLNVANLNQGVYLITLEANNKRHTQRIIKQ